MFWKPKKKTPKECAFDETLQAHSSELSTLRVKAQELTEVLEKRKKIQGAIEVEITGSLAKLQGE